MSSIKSDMTWKSSHWHYIKNRLKLDSNFSCRDNLAFMCLLFFHTSWALPPVTPAPLISVSLLGVSL